MAIMCITTSVHSEDPHYSDGPDIFEQRQAREDDPTHYGGLQCSYCGSLHPTDVLRLLKEGGVRIELADMKYGWPHKFYLRDVPNERAGQRVVISKISVPEHGHTLLEVERKYPAYEWYLDRQHNCFEGREFGVGAKTMMAKFYAVHMLDASEDVFSELARIINIRSGIAFARDANGLLLWGRAVPGA